MPKPDKGNAPTEVGTPVQVSTNPYLPCTECHAQVLVHDMPLHQIWHEGVSDKITKAEKTLKREPRMSSLAQEMNP